MENNREHAGTDVRGAGCGTYRHGRCCGNCASFEGALEGPLPEQRCSLWAGYFAYMFAVCDEWTVHKDIADEVAAEEENYEGKEIIPVAALGRECTQIDMRGAERTAAREAAILVTLSPCEWAWTVEQQAAMARYVLWASQRLEAVSQLAGGAPLLHEAGLEGQPEKGEKNG